MAFLSPITAGTKLIIEAIQSQNYVAGIDGWTINRDGTAEFLDLFMRGELIVDGPNGYLRLYNFDDGGGTTRPSMYFFYDNGVDPSSDGYIWYDQTADRGRMRIHVNSPSGGEDVDLVLTGGNSSGGYVRVTREIRATNPTSPGISDTWHGLLTIAAWSNVGTQITQYRLTPTGDVQFRGLQAPNANQVANTVITSSPLPVAYWPTAGYSATCALALQNGSTSVNVEVSSTTGDVITRTAVNSGQRVDFHGLRYSTTLFP